MSAPAYKDLSATIVANLLNATLNPGTLVGANGLALQPVQFPALPAVNLTYGGPTPVTPGQFNVAGVQRGSLVASTTVDIDHMTLKGLQNEAISLATYLIGFLWVFDATAGHIVTVDTSHTNGLIALTGGAAGKVVASPGIAGANGAIGAVPLVLGNLNPGVTVDSTHKILTLDPGSNAIAAYLYVVLGISS